MMNDDDQSVPRDGDRSVPEVPNQPKVDQTGNFNATSDLGSDSRATDEPTLAARGGRLIDSRAAKSDDGFGFAPTADIPSVSDTEAVDSHQIGNYRLLQRIGAGGMGEVWVAEQTHPVNRRVALKLIKSGHGSRMSSRPFLQTVPP